MIVFRHGLSLAFRDTPNLESITPTKPTLDKAAVYRSIIKITLPPQLYIFTHVLEVIPPNCGTVICS